MNNVICVIAVKDVGSKIKCDLIFSVDHNESSCRSVPAEFTNGSERKGGNGIHVNSSAQAPTVTVKTGRDEIIQGFFAKMIFLHKLYAFLGKQTVPQ